MVFKIVNPINLQVEYSYTADEVAAFGGPWGQYPHVPVPEGMDPDCVVAQMNGEAIELIEDAALLAAKALRVKQAEVSAAYDRMNADVYNEMQLVFGTTKSDSATAFHETWKLMAATPALFVNEGLKADKEVGSFHVGDELNTEQLVTDYANARMYEANGYSVYRMKRIEQFRTERATILGGGQ